MQADLFILKFIWICALQRANLQWASLDLKISSVVFENDAFIDGCKLNFCVSDSYQELPLSSLSLSQLLAAQGLRCLDSSSHQDSQMMMAQIYDFDTTP